MCICIFEKNFECNCLKFSSLYDLKLTLDFSCSKKESLLVKNEFKKRKEQEQASFSHLELGSYTDAVCSVMFVHYRYNSIWLEVGLKMWDFLELASEITIYWEMKVFEGPMKVVFRSTSLGVPLPLGQENTRDNNCLSGQETFHFISKISQVIEV